MSLSDDIELLTTRFVAAEQIPEPAAARLARDILGAGPDIRASAMAWARSGVFPTTPVIHGENPASIARAFPHPSRVFWMLVILRREPTAALLTLKHARAATTGQGGGAPE